MANSNEPAKKQPVAQGFVTILAHLAGARQSRTGEYTMKDQAALELARSAKVIWAAAQAVWLED